MATSKKHSAKVKSMPAKRVSPKTASSVKGGMRQGFRLTTAGPPRGLTSRR